MFRFAMIFIVAISLLASIILLLIPVFTDSPYPDKTQENDFVSVTEDGVLIVIPEGTGAAYDAGDIPTIIHGDIVLTVGSQDRLTVRNDDIVPHTIAMFYVDAGQTVSQRFTRPEVYEATCSFQGDGIRVIVRPEQR